MRPNIVSVRVDKNRIKFNGEHRFIVTFDMAVNYGGISPNPKEKYVWGVDEMDAYANATKGIERIYGKG